MPCCIYAAFDTTSSRQQMKYFQQLLKTLNSTVVKFNTWMKTIYLNHLLVTSSTVMHFPSSLKHRGATTYGHLEEMQGGFETLSLPT